MHGATHPGAPRAVLVALVGGALLAALVGCGSNGEDRGEALAKVGSHTIYEADLDERIQAMPGMARTQYSGEDGRRQLLEKIVQEEMFFQAAEAAGMASHPDVEEELERVRRNAMLRAYYDEEIRKKAEPSPDEVEAYYREHLEEFRTQPRVRAVSYTHLTLPTN